MAWTDERVERLRELWAEGLTASQIATSLGGVSRNAVIGKVHRLGLSNRSGTEKQPEPEAEAEEPVELKKKEAAAPAEAPVEEPKAQAEEPTIEQSEQEDVINPVMALAAEVERSARKLSLLELNERTCKWPIGDPSTDDFYFCGLPCAVDKPYCSAHVAVAYQPMSSRRDRERGRGRAASA